MGFLRPGHRLYCPSRRSPTLVIHFQKGSTLRHPSLLLLDSPSSLQLEINPIELMISLLVLHSFLSPFQVETSPAPLRLSSPPDFESMWMWLWMWRMSWQAATFHPRMASQSLQLAPRSPHRPSPRGSEAEEVEEEGAGGHRSSRREIESKDPPRRKCDCNGEIGCGILCRANPN